MRNKLLLIFILVFLTTLKAENKENKKGWVVVGVPALSFDTDLGVQYGLVGNIFDFGDGSRYPFYDHSVYIELSKYTKGNQLLIFAYDSDKLIKGIRSTIGVDYQHDMLSYFFGFNGHQSVFNDSILKQNRAFYRFDNQIFRLKADFQDSISGSHWGWLVGVSVMNFTPNTVDIEKINEDNTNTVKNLPNEPQLYDKYVEWGIISEEETKSNWINYVKAGLKYDTRNNRANPSSGVFSEILLQTAPAFLNNNFPHAKFAAIHRQYFPIIKKRLTGAYRIFYQTNLGNYSVPFFVQPLLINSYETGLALQGLGGGRSLRGIMRNRLVGNGFLLANIELRCHFFDFKLFKQFFDVGGNVFLDNGYITKEINIDEYINSLNEQDKKIYFSDKKQSIHSSTGMGLKVIMNQNFVMSGELGYALDKQNGEGLRMYINIGYSF